MLERGKHAKKSAWSVLSYYQYVPISTTDNLQLTTSSGSETGTG